MKRQHWWRRKLPASWGAFWLLASAAVLGVILMVTTGGLPHTLGAGLAGACVVIDVQLAAILRRASR